MSTISREAINNPRDSKLLTIMASRMFFLMSSIFCRFSVSLKPFTCKILICLTMVDLPDSPAPSKSNRCVARYTCLSFCNCLVIASLRRFCDLESSEVWPLEPCEPKQPMAHARGPHQQPPPPSAPTAPPPWPVACPVATAAVHSPLTRSLYDSLLCVSRAAISCFRTLVLNTRLSYSRTRSHVCSFVSQPLSAPRSVAVHNIRIRFHRNHYH